MVVHPGAEVSRQSVEQLADVLSQLGVGCEERYVRILLGGGCVVVARTHVGVPHELVPFETDDLQELGMDLEVHGAVHYVHPYLLHLPSPLYVVALVELRPELHEHRHGLPVLLGAHERLDQRRVLADPVQADLDALHVRVLGGLVDEPHDG